MHHGVHADEGGLQSLTRRGGDFGNSPGLAFGRVGLYVCSDERVHVVTDGFLLLLVLCAGLLLSVVLKSPYFVVFTFCLLFFSIFPLMSSC